MRTERRSDTSGKQTGPVRSTRTRSRTATTPYPRRRAGEPAGNENAANNAAALWRCPRNGIVWIASNWQSAVAPAQSSNPQLLSFITSLTQNLSLDNVSEHGLSICHLLNGLSSGISCEDFANAGGTNDIVEVVRRCKQASDSDSFSSLVVMISCVQLVFKCKR